MKKALSYFSGLVATAVVAVNAGVAHALDGFENTDNLTGGGQIAQEDNIIETVFTIINWVLIVTGAFAVLMLIIGGFRYITSAGNQTQVDGARKTMTYAIMGLVIVLLAFVIAATIDNIILNS